ncbi:hypothetical protein PPL_01675 [Heterostelium album PN500]|uniref:Phosphatidic acid phosphatase type 2/haloperoxidase domain-containing protein n=1 Tax=Heterostelium pallidum (strain ATCC 26659 / Pp 5 / PN500) TaxID=670386 RepID=D3B059_HETP5|nr:hypothetical protein PPL_01675 [Heterostelium album PN500]EFA84683.1 hypothetical protein PPL_01675 [Heterostelium album PN500]|eukprot:XP_020436796.1 hypothetical protein PPL_01675 [Heterostelium album PN500]
MVEGSESTDNSNNENVGNSCINDSNNNSIVVNNNENNNNINSSQNPMINNNIDIDSSVKDFMKPISIKNEDNNLKNSVELKPVYKQHQQQQKQNPETCKNCHNRISNNNNNLKNNTNNGNMGYDSSSDNHTPFLSLDIRRRYRVAIVLGLIQSFGLTLLLVAVIKCFIGGLRPNFLVRCKPTPESLARATPVGFNQLYYSKEVCTGDEADILDGMAAYPSGHAGLAACGLVFLALFLHARLKTFNNRGHLFIYVMILMCICGAVLVGVSRIVDYRHTFGNVLLGWTIGVICSLSTYRLNYLSLFGHDNHISVAHYWVWYWKQYSTNTTTEPQSVKIARHLNDFNSNKQSYSNRNRFKMDEADGIILLTLRDLGCELGDEITIKDFDAEIVYKACLAYLRVINEAKVANLTATIPKNMSARVNSCSVLAATIRETGYRAELSYHNLLYPNINDVRRIFVFLGQHLPKKEVVEGDSTASLKDLICNHLASSIKESWMPYFCPFTKRIPGNYSTAKLFTVAPLKIPARGRQLKLTPGLEDFYIKHLRPINQQPNRTDDVAPSVFEYNLSIYAEAQERENEWNTKGSQSGLNPLEYKKNKSKTILSKMNDSIRSAMVDGSSADSRRNNTFDHVIGQFGMGSADDDYGQFARKKAFTNEEVASEPIEPKAKETEEERQQKQQEEIDQLQSVLEELANRMANATSEMDDWIQQIRQLEAQINEEDRKRAELEKEYKVKKKTFGLLENAEENFAKLQELCQQTSASLIEMSGEWEKVRRPIIEKYRQLKDEKANQSDEAKSKVERIKEIRALIKKMIADIRAKEELFTQLQDTYKAMPKDTNRSMYTRRIIESVKNIKKQKEDIDRILLDTRTLQKEINTITDTAVRTFDAVKDMLYADAKKDQTAKTAIKSFAVIDEKFQTLLTAIDETGTYQNNIFTLTSKIDYISQKTNTLNTDRVLNDLKTIKAENQTLIAQVKSKMASAGSN